MPLSYSEEGEQLADKSPCAQIRAQLKMCLLDSDCCKKVHFICISNENICIGINLNILFFILRKEKVLPRDCLKRNDHTVPEQCHQLKYSFFECKRSIVSQNSDSFDSFDSFGFVMQFVVFFLVFSST